MSINVSGPNHFISTYHHTGTYQNQTKATEKKKLQRNSMSLYIDYSNKTASKICYWSDNLDAFYAACLVHTAYFASSLWSYYDCVHPLSLSLSLPNSIITEYHRIFSIYVSCPIPSSAHISFDAVHFVDQTFSPSVWHHHHHQCHQISSHSQIFSIIFLCIFCHWVR